MWGYAAAGLGCLLVHNVKTINASDHANPMALVTVKSGSLTDRLLEKGLSEMFEWNWEWRAKAHGPDMFLMRFHSKAILKELLNFDEFKLRFTGAAVEVTNWLQPAIAQGKLHTVWVRASGIPHTMKGYLVLNEVGSFLGVVD